MRWQTRAALSLSLAVAAGCAPVPPASSGATGDYAGTYCGTARTVTPGGTTSGAVTFSCGGGACADPTGSFIGNVDSSGWFSGSTKVCAACARFPMSGQMSITSTFVISGASGGGSSQTVTASYCGSGGGGGGGGGDTTPPTQPTGLTVTPTSLTNIDLSWAASTDDGGVATYELYRNGAGSPFATSTGTSASDPGREMATRYCYTVRAVDAAGNRSAPSAEVCATTPCESNSPTAPGTPQVWATGETALQVSWGSSNDDTGVVGYRLYRDGALSGTVPDPGNLATLTASDPGRTRLTRSCYQLEAQDGCGNVSPRSGEACAWTIGILVSGAAAPERVKVDATHVYWSEADARIMRASLADGAVSTVTTQLLFSAFAIDDARAYYASFTGGLPELRSVPKDGGSYDPLAAWYVANDLVAVGTTVYAAGGNLLSAYPVSGGAPPYFAAGGAWRLAVDATDVYWTTHEAGHAVRKAPLAAALPAPGGGSPGVSVASGHGPYAVAVDATHVYWTEDGSAGGTASIRKRPKDLSGPTVVLATRPNLSPFGIALDDTDVYWVEMLSVRAIGKDGSRQRTLVEWPLGAAHNPFDVAVDGTHVYWVERTSGYVAKIPK